MGEAGFDYQFGSGIEHRDTSRIGKMVAGSTSPMDAFRQLAQFLETKNTNLLMAAVLGGWENARPAVLFDNNSQSIAANCKEVGLDGMCPMLMKAQDLKVPFEALGAPYSSHAELPTKRYVNSLARLGHQEIGVIPTVIDDMVYVMIIGMQDGTFSSKSRETLLMICGQYMASFSVKYILANKPENRAEPAPIEEAGASAMLTQREIALLTYTARGNTLFELSSLLGVSEHTVNIYNQVICKKLGVTNVTQALIKAIRKGMIDTEGVN